MKRNKKSYDKLSEHIGLIPLIIASPSDAELVYGGSDDRRKLSIVPYRNTISIISMLLSATTRRLPSETVF